MKKFDLEKVNNVYMTYEYNEFKKINGNRKLNKKNLEKLEKSMKEKQLEIPIVVNEKMEVIDGQHRFEICKKLELPVYFIIISNYGVDEVIKANTVSEKWKTGNFIESHLGTGKKEYEFLEHIINKNIIKLSILEMLISRVTNKKVNEVKESINSGKFNLTVKEKGKVLDFLSSLLKFGNEKKYKSRAFILAYMEMYFFEEIDKIRLENSLIRNKETRIGEYLTKERYLIDFVRIYNVKLKRKIHISDMTGKLFVQEN